MAGINTAPIAPNRKKRSVHDPLILEVVYGSFKGAGSSGAVPFKESFKRLALCNIYFFF